jgi:hypothetical protein
VIEIAWKGTSKVDDQPISWLHIRVCKGDIGGPSAEIMVIVDYYIPQATFLNSGYKLLTVFLRGDLR